MEVVKVHPYDMYLKLLHLAPVDILKLPESKCGTLEADGVLYVLDKDVPPTLEAVQAVER